MAIRPGGRYAQGGGTHKGAGTHQNFAKFSSIILLLPFILPVFWRATPLVPLRKPWQYIYQNVRLDQDKCAITFGKDQMKINDEN